MKTLKVDPLSACVGVLIASSCVLLASAQFQHPIAKARIEQVIVGIPTPDQMLRIDEGTPFVVPQGRILVVTGLAARDFTVTSAVDIDLLFDGSSVLRGRTQAQGNGTLSLTGAGPSIIPVPAGMTAASGVTVSVVSSEGSGVLLAYLAEA